MPRYIHMYLRLLRMFMSIVKPCLVYMCQTLVSDMKLRLCHCCFICIILQFGVHSCVRPLCFLDLHKKLRSFTCNLTGYNSSLEFNKLQYF